MFMDDIETLMERAANLELSGAAARKAGEETAADGFFQSALKVAVKAVDQSTAGGSLHVRLNVLRATARLSLDCGEVVEARRLIDEASEIEGFRDQRDEWAELRDPSAWPDGWLIAAVRRDPPDASALDALVDRYWKTLFGRCLLLTANHEKANDLAQDAWCRVLRARHALKPGGNFPAYVTTVATNLWRDTQRFARRAGPMAEHRMSSLDAPVLGDEGETIVLAEGLPDLNSRDAEEHKLLALDIDRALEELEPRLRDVLVARFITGESAAEIGERYGRTEQTVTGWIREAIRQMKLYLEEPAQVAGGGELV